MNSELIFDNKLDAKMIFKMLGIISITIPLAMLFNVINHLVSGEELHLWYNALHDFLWALILTPTLTFSFFRNKYRIIGDYFYVNEHILFKQTMLVNLPINMIENVEMKHGSLYIYVDGQRFSIYCFNHKNALYQTLKEKIGK